MRGKSLPKRAASIEHSFTPTCTVEYVAGGGKCHSASPCLGHWRFGARRPDAIYETSRVKGSFSFAWTSLPLAGPPHTSRDITVSWEAYSPCPAGPHRRLRGSLSRSTEVPQDMERSRKIWCGAASQGRVPQDMVGSRERR